MNIYTTAEISGVWSAQSVLAGWRSVEIAVLHAQSQLGVVPTSWYRLALERPVPSTSDWEAATARCGHEMVGFLDAWGLDHVHIGITSSDIVDTALALRIRATNNIVLWRLDALHFALTGLVGSAGGQPRLGRTHGQAAAPMLLGHVFERWLGAVHRAERLLRLSRADVEVCMISGPVGSYLHVSPAVEALVAERLGLRVAGAQSQIVTRDALAVWVAQMAGIVTICEAIGLELRLMQHTSIGEALPPAGVSSSAMPHKTNPSRAERLAGLGRLSRSFYEPVASGVPQWHERDMAHSSVERTILPQLAGFVSFALEEVTELLTRTHFDPARAKAALDSSALEAHTHSAQTALQLAGVSHGEAQRVTLEAYRASTSLKQFIKRIERHDSKPKFKTPTPHS